MPKKKIVKKPTKKTASYGTSRTKGIERMYKKRGKKSAKA